MGVFSSGAVAKTIAHNAVRAVPRQQVANWTTRFEQHLQQIKETQTPRVVFLGDSITESWQWEGAEAWHQFFKDGSDLALGLGGDRTEHLLWRLENGYLNLFMENPPKAIFLLIGTNNIWENSEREVADGILKIVELLRSSLSHTRIYVSAILPYGAEPNRWRDRINGVNRIVALQLKGRNGVDWLNFNSKFLDDQGQMITSLTTDYLHLTAEGYKIFGRSILTGLHMTAVTD